MSFSSSNFRAGCKNCWSANQRRATYCLRQGEESMMLLISHISMVLPQETVLPDSKLATEALSGESKPLPDDSVLYLVLRLSGDSFEKIKIEDINLPGE
jgi:hypothetical protein